MKKKIKYQTRGFVAKLISYLPFRYAWAAHPGGHWAAAVASGIPFGLGAFVLFVGFPSCGLCHLQMKLF